MVFFKVPASTEADKSESYPTSAQEAELNTVTAFDAADAVTLDE